MFALALITVTILIVCGSIILINPRVFFFGIHEKPVVRLTPQEENAFEINSVSFTESFTETN